MKKDCTNIECFECILSDKKNTLTWIEELKEEEIMKNIITMEDVVEKLTRLNKLKIFNEEISINIRYNQITLYIENESLVSFYAVSFSKNVIDAYNWINKQIEKSTKIKNCPNCGSEMIYRDFRDKFLVCSNLSCFVKSHTFSKDISKKEVIKKWNESIW